MLFTDIRAMRRRTTRRRTGLAAAATAAVVAATVTASLGTAAAAPGTIGRAAAPPPASSLGALPAAERAAVERARPRPLRVTDLAPYRDGQVITLGWHNPDARTFQQVVVRYRRGATAPSTPADGLAVPVASPRASTAALHHLRAGRRYTAAVWTRGAGGRVSPRTATTFVVPAAAAHVSAVLGGRITDTAGHPLSGVVVSASAENSGQTVATTVTSAAGTYELRVPADPYWIGLDGSNGSGGIGDSTGYLASYRDVNLAAHQRLTYNAVMRPGAALTGRVTDAAGQPLAGVPAMAVPAWNYVVPDVNENGFFFEFPAQQATTAADGSFELKGLYPDSFRACFDPNDGAYYPTDVGFGYSEQCADTPHQLHVGHLVDVGSVPLATTPRGAIIGRVTAPSGKGVAGASVTARPVGRRYAVAYTESGPRGGYDLGGLKPGVYRVCAQPSHGATAGSQLGSLGRCRTKHVTVTASSIASGRRIVVRPGGAVSGVVRAANGAPVAGASVTLGRGWFEQGALTDAHGRWTISGVRSGRYRVCVDTSSAAVVRGMPYGTVSGCGAPQLVRRGRIRIGADSTLAPGAAIRGTVTGSGRPVRFIAVSPDTRSNDPGRQAFTFTGRHGNFVLRGLEAGTYRLCFYDGRANSTQRGTCPDRHVAARSGHLTDYGTGALAPAGTVQVRVTDAAGTPLNGVDAAVLTPCRRMLCDRSPLVAGRFRVAASWTTYGNGTVNLTGLPPKTYAVCLFGYLAAPAHGATPLTGYSDVCTPGFDVRVRAGRTAEVSEPLALAGEVTGTVTNAAGNPVAGAQLHITGSAVDDVPRQIWTVYDDPTEPGSITAADGAYAVRSVAPGDATVCVDPTNVRSRTGYQWQCLGAAPGRHNGGTPVTVTPGQVTDGVDVVLQPQ